jgi:O-antigen/teichoic acid export membrane protein
LQAFYVSVLKGIESFKSIFWLNTIVTPVNLLAVVYIVWKGGDIYTFVFLYLGITAFYYVVSSYFANKETEREDQHSSVALTTDDKERMNGQIRLLYMTALLGFFVDRQMEVFFLNVLATPEEAGYYNVAFMLSFNAVELIPGLLVGVLLPIMAKSKAEGLEIQAYRYREVGRYLMLLTAPVIIFVAAYSDVIIEMLYGSEYQKSAMPLAVLVLAAALAPLAGSANSILVSHERQRIVLKLILVSAIINILLDYVLISLFSLNGAVISFAIVKLALSIVVLILASNVLKTGLNYLYYMKVLLLAAIAVFPLMLLKGLLAPILSFPLAGIIFVVAYFLLLVQFRMFSGEDVELLQHIKDKLPGGSILFNERIFTWMKSRQYQS